MSVAVTAMIPESVGVRSNVPPVESVFNVAVPVRLPSVIVKVMVIGWAKSWYANASPVKKLKLNTEVVITVSALTVETKSVRVKITIRKLRSFLFLFIFITL